MLHARIRIFDPMRLHMCHGNVEKIFSPPVIICFVRLLWLSSVFDFNDYQYFQVRVHICVRKPSLLVYMMQFLHGKNCLVFKESSGTLHFCVHPFILCQNCVEQSLRILINIFDSEIKRNILSIALLF